MSEVTMNEIIGKTIGEGNKCCRNFNQDSKVSEMVNLVRTHIYLLN